MAGETLAPPISDDLWRALGINLPDACRAHHCWVDECPAGSHDETARETA